jgi:bifunctional DNA-binding transcriptional regulator/antitoxin component of YhaV-PrlF toxin-antitoxin module
VSSAKRKSAQGVKAIDSQQFTVDSSGKEKQNPHLTDVKTTVSSKGQIALPAELWRMDRIEPGQVFDVERLARGEYRLIRRAAPRNEGVIDWLLACPHKNFFAPLESESTETL